MSFNKFKSNKDFEASVIKRRRKAKKNRKKVKMNVFYKIAFFLFVICFGCLITAMVLSFVNISFEHNDFLSILFSYISAGTALLGIIFACVSKEKKPKKHKPKRKHINNKNEDYYDLTQQKTI